MLGLARPVETRTVEITGTSLADVHARAIAALPVGWELISAPVAMSKSSTTLAATATFARRDGIIELEAANMTDLQAELPEGYQLLSVRA